MNSNKVCQNCHCINNNEAQYCADCGENIESINNFDSEGIDALKKGLNFLSEDNIIEALYYMKIAEEKGNLGAQGSLAEIFLGHYGVSKDYTESIKWSMKFLNNKDSLLDDNIEFYKLTNYNLGVMYDSFGGDLNYKEAMKFYKMSAEKKHSSACNNIGISYLQGKGVTADPREALIWFEKALEYDPFNKLARPNIVNAKILKATSCFIATAVYDSPTVPKVMILREFRDQKLLSNKLGKNFILIG